MRARLVPTVAAATVAATLVRSEALFASFTMP